METSTGSVWEKITCGNQTALFERVFLCGLTNTFIYCFCFVTYNLFRMFGLKLFHFFNRSF